MFDFRYHAISLAAVFLALLVGLLLGVAIGDAQLVSGARENIRAGLRGEVADARREAASARRDRTRSEDFADQAYPALVDGRLTGRRIGLVFISQRSRETFERVRDALRPSGAMLASVSTLREPIDVAGLAGAARDTRYAALQGDPGLLGPLARRLGVQMTQGGRLLQRVRRTLLSSSSGDLEGMEGVVIAHSAQRPEGEPGEQAEAFERALVDGLQETNVPAVGVELTSTDPSQVPWFNDRGLASVDNLDQVAGRAALVFALGGADGAFGIKRTADDLLPDTVRPGG